MHAYSEPTELIPVEAGAGELRLRHLALAAALLIVLIQLAGGEDLGAAAAMLGLGLAFPLAFLTDWRYLPTLVLLSLPALGVVTEGEAGSGGLLSLAGIHFPGAVPYVFLGGVQFGVPLVVILAGFARVVLALVTRGWRSGNASARWLLVLLLIGLIPALLGGLQGQAMGMNRWSFGIRGMLAIGGVFWGAMLVARAEVERQVLVGQLTRIVAVGAALALFGVIRGHFLFLVIGLSAGCVFHLLRTRSIALIPTMLVSLFAPLVATLTVAAQVLFAWLALAIASRRIRFARRLLVRLSIAGAIVASAGMIALVVAMSYDVGIVAGEDAGLLSFVMFKLLGDRGPLWLAAIAQIMAGPHLIMPAGRPLLPENFLFLRGGLDVWEHGAHNTVLELVRNVGLIAGPIALLVMVNTLVRVGQVLINSSDPALLGLAAGILAVAIPGITTGNYPIEDVGFFLWGVAGMVLSLSLMEQQERLEEELGEEPAGDYIDSGVPFEFAGRSG
jgi:hypothetical protein